jgi:hypothetical protein
MPKMSRTYGPIHFEDLEPHRFEDLIRELIYDFKDWQSIEATGRSGADEGIDIRGYERVISRSEPGGEGDEDDDPAESHPMQGNMWIIQCKREKEIGPKKLAKILDEIDTNDPPYGYILAASANFSKVSYDAFRTQLLKKGVMEFYLWGKPELEGMLHLPKNDRVLFTFFGVSLVSRRRSRSTEIRGKVAAKNKLLRILGEGAGHWPVLLRDANDEHYPFEGQYPDFDKNPRWKQFEALRIHPHGLVVRQRKYFAYLDLDHKKFDFSEKASLIMLHRGFDADDREDQRQERDARELVEDFWDHLPNSNKAEYCKNALVKFEDMLVIDEKGISPDKYPHIFVDFQGIKGPFSGSFEFLEVRRGYGDPEKIYINDFERVKIFPESFPPPPIGTVYPEGAIQLDQDLHRLIVNGNEAIKDFCDVDEKHGFLKPRDIFILKSARDNSLKYFQITNVQRTTVGEHLSGQDAEFRKGELERQLKTELTDSAALNIFEFKPTYDWRIERMKPQDHTSSANDA